MTPRPFIEKEFRRFRAMPRTLWVVLVAGVVFLLANMISLLSIGGLKIDPGTATLFGAVIGLCVVAWQTSKGFQNLIRSQENQSRLERQARLHRHELERTSAEDEENRERQLLLSGLRAEMISLHSTAYGSATTQHQFALLYKAMHEHGAPATMKEFTISGYKAAFYKENISKLGLINVSLAADIIRVYSMVFDDRKVVWEKAAPNSVVAVAYATGAVLAYRFNADLYHVAMRIRSLEEGSADPGTLQETEAQRHAKLPKLEDMVPEKMV
ncbi:hypothetical protein AC629_11090 [Bradyrhizobium sp. NAS80.1]|uniref:hypothetical protein n=1 Tax=Bradyrhizobium sp. NAS80.1 TaxID=1680159 RepID=UPI000962EAFE|nr:hypothetical protein [Bradyrhizobium sp. NAS80.1]OKO88083.1 hypothetical protein AC629_11090 [Bradyrhizobium sp. NAS80.1]